MSLLDYSRHQIEAFNDEIKQVKESDFPYTDSQEVLTLIEKIFLNYLNSLNSINEENDAATVRVACNTAANAIYNYLPLVGFILRSTNLRNAFEVYGPLRTLTKQLIGADAKLIISSDWECSPFNFRIPNFHNLVLIGLPVQESANPFLIPLAGHELGHTLSLNNLFNTPDFKNRIRKKVIKEILTKWSQFHTLFPSGITENPPTEAKIENDLIVLQNLQPAIEFATRQCLETFCDFIGLGIFSEAFLYANAYILLLNRAVERPLFYPNIKQRVRNLIKASTAFGIDVPNNYLEMFEDLKEPKDEKMKFLVSLADTAALSFVDDLIVESKKIITEKNIPIRSKEKVKEIYEKDIRMVIPSRKPETLTNILNAAWLAFNDKSLWGDLSEIKSKKDTLVDVVLKSIEVLEFKQLTGT